MVVIEKHFQLRVFYWLSSAALLVGLCACQPRSHDFGLPDAQLIAQRHAEQDNDALQALYKALQPLKTFEAETECSAKLVLAEGLAQLYPEQLAPWFVQWLCLRQAQSDADSETLHADRIETIRLWLVEQMDQLEKTGDGVYPETGMQANSLYDAFTYVQLLGLTILDVWLQANANGQLLIFNIDTWDEENQLEQHWHFNMQPLVDNLMVDLGEYEQCRFYPANCILQYVAMPGFETARQIGYAKFSHADNDFETAEETLKRAAEASGHAALYLADLMMLDANYAYDADVVIEYINKAIGYSKVNASIVASVLMEYDYVVEQSIVRSQEFIESANAILPPGEALFRRAEWINKASLEGIDVVAAYQAAVAAGSAAALRELAYRYYDGELVEQDKQRALEMLLQAANRNDREAQKELSRVFLNDEPFIDIGLSAHWGRRAAEQNSPVALMRLGYLFSEHPEWLQDGEYAHLFSEKAAEFGNALAYNNYAHAAAQNEFAAEQEQIFGWYLHAAMHGEGLAELSTAWRYHYGKGVEVDYAKARYWYEKALASGQSEAKLYLGHMHYEGAGQAVNFRDAFLAYNDISANDPHNAGWMLGQMYEYAQGISYDAVKARHWYQQAVQTGSTNAAVRLGWLHESGQGGPVDIKEATRLYTWAAENKNSDGLTNLAWLYDAGIGISDDLAKAREYYQQSIANSQQLGNEPAARVLENLQALDSSGQTYLQRELNAIDEVLAGYSSLEAIDGETAIQVAERYANLKGDPERQQKSLEYTRRAMQQGHPQAYVNLGLAYYTGNGVEKDLSKVCELTNSPAVADDLRMLYVSRFCFDSATQPDAYYQRLKQAADLGYAAAQLEQAYWLLINEYEDTTVDLEQMLDLLKQHANAETPNAQAALWIGLLFERQSELVDVDEKTGTKYYLQAAKAGLTAGQNNLGRLILMGKTDIESKESGYRWVRTAYLQGSMAAADTLGEMYEYGWYKDKDWQQALHYYEIAANDGEGIPISMHNCGRLLSQGGHGLTKDANQAERWFELAEQAGYQVTG